MVALFEFQAQGADFLSSTARGYLGDEMGLGKTPQAICAFNKTGCKSVHVIAPASAVPNWHREIQTWAENPDRWTVNSYGLATTYFPPAQIYVCDEAQYLKDPSSRRTSVILGQDSELHGALGVWPLSGTPAPNNILEMWTWLDFFGATDLTYQRFLSRFCKFKHGPYGPKILGMKNVKELKEMLAPVLLRRMKRDVQQDLPPILWGEISLVAKSTVDLARQSAALLVDDDNLPAEDENMAKARRLLGEAKAGPLAEFLAEELEATEKKIVVMAHHTSVLDIIAARLLPFGVARIDGSTSQARRGTEVVRFQTDPNCRVFVGQLVAAGTAITLTAAADFVFAEMSWTPGDNWQAAMRVHRIGQTKNVLIRVASLEGSLDEAVSRVLTRKTQLLQQVFEEEIPE